MWSPTKLLVLIMFFGSVAHACDCVTDCKDCPKGTTCERTPVWVSKILCQLLKSEANTHIVYNYRRKFVPQGFHIHID